MVASWPNIFVHAGAENLQKKCLKVSCEVEMVPLVDLPLTPTRNIIKIEQFILQFIQQGYIFWPFPNHQGCHMGARPALSLD